MFAEKIVRSILEESGVTINGNAPWDIQVHDKRFYLQVLTRGSLGLGESYMHGWWDCRQLDKFFDRVLQGGVPWIEVFNPVSLLFGLMSSLMNMMPRHKAFVVGEHHYDRGNKLFEAMLDESMTYSCAYFEDLPRRTDQLHTAQLQKLDLICRKLQLKPWQRVLDIGCGWGSFAAYAAKYYNAEVIGLTVSKEQAALARERCRGLPVEIRLQDYRDVVTEKFDHVVSVGMFEHVGAKNYRTFMQVAERCLKPDGLFLLHTIGSRDQLFHSLDPWIRKWIFPNSQIPMRKQIHKSRENLLFVQDWHEFGSYYDTTLMCWYERFVAAWPELQAEYGEKFFRMWSYYLLCCAGAFRAGHLKLWQVLFSHHTNTNTYSLVR